MFFSLYVLCFGYIRNILCMNLHLVPWRVMGEYVSSLGGIGSSPGISTGSSYAPREYNKEVLSTKVRAHMKFLFSNESERLYDFLYSMFIEP